MGALAEFIQREFRDTANPKNEKGRAAIIAIPAIPVSKNSKNSENSRGAFSEIASPSPSLASLSAAAPTIVTNIIGSPDDRFAPIDDPKFWQGVADQRNAAAEARNGSDRYCSCQKIAMEQTFDKESGRLFWVCDDCQEPPPFAAKTVVDFEIKANGEGARRRNDASARAEKTDRWCSCGMMATVAVGHFKASRVNPEGVEAWICVECFHERLSELAMQQACDGI